MRIFEFQFNPKVRQDRFFRVFSFDPAEDMQEKGSMYIVGELANALPSNSNFLRRLSDLLGQEYYDTEKPSDSVPQRLKHALKKANEFLTEETKKGNVDWLGNLHFLVLLIVPGASDGHTLYFAKIGQVRLWMARNGSLVDAGKSIEGNKKEEGSATMFGNVGSGNVLVQDRIVALTPEAFEFFSKDNLLQTITRFKEQKQFKTAFKAKEKEISQLSGILFFILIEAATPVKSRDKGESSALPKLPIPSFPRLSKFSLALPSLSLPAFPKKKWSFFVASEAKKRTGLLALLLFVLLLGFAILGNEPADTSRETRRLEPRQEELSEEIRRQYKITEIPAPEVVATLDTSELAETPQQFILLDGAFYLFHPSGNQLVSVDPASNSQTIISASRNLRFGDTFANTFVFFADPNILLSFTEAKGWEESVISFPRQFSPQGMKAFGGNVYLFDGSLGEIVKVVQGRGQSWLEAASPKRPLNAASIAIDGSVWVLKSNGEVQRYFRGVYQETLAFDIVPVLTSAQSIETTNQTEYVYILDAAKARVVVLGKTGELLAQYTSEAFGQASDLLVSPDGSMIYLLAGDKIYRVAI